MSVITSHWEGPGPELPAVEQTLSHPRGSRPAQAAGGEGGKTGEGCEEARKENSFAVGSAGALGGQTKAGSVLSGPGPRFLEGVSQPAFRTVLQGPSAPPQPPQVELTALSCPHSLAQLNR